MFLGPRLFKESQCILPFSVSLAWFHRPSEAENVRIYCRLFHAVKHPHCTRPCTTPGSIIDACLSDIRNFQARPSSKVSPPKTNGRIFVGWFGWNSWRVVIGKYQLLGPSTLKQTKFRCKRKSFDIFSSNAVAHGHSPRLQILMAVLKVNTFGPTCVWGINSRKFKERGQDHMVMWDVMAVVKVMTFGSTSRQMFAQRLTAKGHEVEPSLLQAPRAAFRFTTFGWTVAFFICFTNANAKDQRADFSVEVMQALKL